MLVSTCSTSRGTESFSSCNDPSNPVQPTVCLHPPLSFGRSIHNLIGSLASSTSFPSTTQRSSIVRKKRYVRSVGNRKGTPSWFRSIPFVRKARSLVSLSLSLGERPSERRRRERKKKQERMGFLFLFHSSFLFIRFFTLPKRDDWKDGSKRDGLEKELEVERNPEGKRVRETKAAVRDTRHERASALERCYARRLASFEAEGRRSDRRARSRGSSKGRYVLFLYPWTIRWNGTRLRSVALDEAHANRTSI